MGARVAVGAAIISESALVFPGPGVPPDIPTRARHAEHQGRAGDGGAQDDGRGADELPRVLAGDYIGDSRHDALDAGSRT